MSNSNESTGGSAQYSSGPQAPNPAEAGAVANHRAEAIVAPRSTGDKRSVFYARCSCGWVGRSRSTLYRAQQNASDHAVKFYDGRANNYDLALDPRCLWGWGPDGKSGCTCMFGHACFRPLGHPGKCWDAGDERSWADEAACARSQRPKDWDAKARAGANK